MADRDAYSIVTYDDPEELPIIYGRPVTAD